MKRGQTKNETGYYLVRDGQAGIEYGRGCALDGAARDSVATL
jgi:hypothetical protein